MSNENARSEWAAAAEGTLGSAHQDAEPFGTKAFGLSACKPCPKCPSTKMSPG